MAFIESHFYLECRRMTRPGTEPMDKLDPLRPLQRLLITPAWQCLSGLFDLNGRLRVVFPADPGTVAYLLCLHPSPPGILRPAAFAASSLGPGRLVAPRPCSITQYYLVRALLHVAVILPIMAWIHPWLLQAEDDAIRADPALGNRPVARRRRAGWMMLYGLGSSHQRLLVHYWLHCAFHSAAGCGSFHKVHHQRDRDGAADRQPHPPGELRDAGRRELPCPLRRLLSIGPGGTVRPYTLLRHQLPGAHLQLPWLPTCATFHVCSPWPLARAPSQQPGPAP